MGNEAYDVFVSYARADSRHAADIDAALRAKGLRPFFDRRNLAPGLPWVRALEQAIGAAKAAIVLIGPRGLGNTQQYERDLALVRQTHDPAFPIVPVILPETTTDPPFDFLRVLTWIDFSRVARVSDAPDLLDQLLTAVRGGQVPADAAREAVCPYRGLDAFREEDSAFFFGRGSADIAESPVGELIRKVRDHPFVIVVGRSGSGKSSLVLAGLVPALRRERDRFWNVLSLRPGPTPLRALAAAFNPRQEAEGAAEYAAKIGAEADRLRTGDPELLSHMIGEELKRAEGNPDRLLLYVDQWEELYAQAPATVDGGQAARHAADVNRFIDLLLSAARTAPVTVVATVRADFYDPLIGHPEIRSLLLTRQVLLGAMPRSELERTIVEPAKKVRLVFDPPGLVQRILDEAGDDEGMLPLLQYALKETWALRAGNAMTADSYARSGGVREAIRITAERTFDALSAEDQQQARRLFLRLVTPGEGQEDTRARAAMPAEPTQRKIVEQFAGARTRLLVTGWDRAARPTVEVAHEALIRTWPRLRGWIDGNREKLRARAAVLQAKAEWEQHERRDDLLLPAGFQLERARALMADPGDLTIDDIQEFIALSSAREEAARQRREDDLRSEEARVARIARLQRFTRSAFAAVAAVVLLAGGIVGFLEWDKARQLAIQQRALEDATGSVATAQAQNVDLKTSLDRRQIELDHARANILAELSTTRLMRGKFESAIRLASRGTRLDLTLPSDTKRASPATAALAAGLWWANWNLGFGGHDGSVSSASFSPDGSRIVTASADKTARIWDAVTTKEIAVLGGHDGSVSSAAFSPDGSRIVTASADKTARIWDAATAKQIAILRGHDSSVSSAAFSPDGSRIVTASADKTARIWNVATAKQIAVLRGHDGEVFSAAFSPDGARIVTASWDRTARIWDAATATEIAMLRGHDGIVSSALFSPDGARIVTASADKAARIWDAATATEIAVLRGHEGPVSFAAFSPDGSRIVTVSRDQTARIWDAATTAHAPKEIGILRGHDDDVWFAAFSPDGAHIVTASKDLTARLWDAATATELAILHGHDEPVSSAAFSPDGARIVTASGDETARIWDAATGAHAPPDVAVLRGHSGSVSTAAFSPDGRRIVTASLDNTARIWDATTGARTVTDIGVLRGHDGSVSSAAFSPDGSRIVTASWDKTARVWDATTGARVPQEIAVLRGHGSAVYSAAFSPNVAQIVTASADDTARVWDVTTGKEVVVLSGHDDDVLSAAFSHGGSRIVTASRDRTARIWNAATGKEIAVLRGHDAAVYSAAFSPDGTRIVTASWDRTARVWDAATAKEIAVLRGHDGFVSSAAFSPDGARIVTASNDKTARIWDARPLIMTAKDLLREACARLAVTKLTRDEMRLAGDPDSTREIDVCQE